MFSPCYEMLIEKLKTKELNCDIQNGVPARNVCQLFVTIFVSERYKHLYLTKHIVQSTKFFLQSRQVTIR